MNYLLCQSRKSLISKLRHLLWLTASESSKIHKVFSAVHPCQPQNLLLLFHSLGFSIDLFWNWLSWVSKPTFKVPQVSVLFNFQGPAALSRFRDSLYIIYQNLSFVKRFSESFLKKFSSKNAYKLYLKASAAVPRAPPARQLWYITTPPILCQHLFSDFLTNFECWKCVICLSFNAIKVWKIEPRVIRRRVNLQSSFIKTYCLFIFL